MLSVGPIGNNAAKAIEAAEKACPGLDVAHYDMRFIKPMDERLLDEIGRNFNEVVTVEDGVRNGGFGSAVLEWMTDHGFRVGVTRLGLPDKFVEHGTVSQLQHIVGIDADSITAAISKAAGRLGLGSGSMND